MPAWRESSAGGGGRGGGLWIGHDDVLLPGEALDVFAAGHLGGNCLLLALAADDEGDGAAGRKLVEHAAELIFAVDGLTIQAEDDILLAQTGLPGGSIVIKMNDLGAAGFLQLEHGKLVFGYVAEIDSEVPARSGTTIRSVVQQEELAGTESDEPGRKARARSGGRRPLQAAGARPRGPSIP